jgi:hypothetical protein
MIFKNLDVLINEAWNFSKPYVQKSLQKQESMQQEGKVKGQGKKKKLWNSFLMKMNNSQNPLNLLRKLNNQIENTLK